MAEKLLMLALSPTMEEGLLVTWHIAEGDTVEEGQVVAEVETDKATMELESFLSGTVLKLLVDAGDSVPVGNPIAVVGEEGEDISDLDAEEPPSEGDDEDEDDAPAPPPPDSADLDASSDDEDDDEDEDGGERDRSDGRRIKASPLARNMAEEAGIDLADVDGSGPQGRIIKRDIEAAMEAQKSASKKADKKAAATTIPAYEPDSWAEDVEPEPLSGMRRTIARRLTQSWVQAPHFFLEASYDMGPAIAFRKQLNEALSGREPARKVSFNDLVVKACALALQDEPEVNVAFSEDGMRHFDGSHIGVAVAVPDGLVVPVIRDAHHKGLATIGAETRDLAGRARDKKLKPDEMTGSTFSVSNLGMFGIDAFTAVINPPEACILAVGAINKVPVVGDDDTLTVGHRMRVTLSCDHRAVDGATGARFLATLRAYLENPLLLAS